MPYLEWWRGWWREVGGSGSCLVANPLAFLGACVGEGRRGETLAGLALRLQENALLQAKGDWLQEVQAGGGTLIWVCPVEGLS